MDIEKSERDRISALENAIEEGMLKGKVEGKLEAAAGMRAKKLPISLIIEVTGLSEEEINQIN